MYEPNRKFDRKEYENCIAFYQRQGAESLIKYYDTACLTLTALTILFAKSMPTQMMINVVMNCMRQSTTQKDLTDHMSVRSLNFIIPTRLFRFSC